MQSYPLGFFDYADAPLRMTESGCHSEPVEESHTYLLDKNTCLVYNKNTKGKTSNGYASVRIIYSIAEPWQRGGYCAFIGEKIITIIIIIATNSFLDICSNMLIRHKHLLLS